MQVKILFNCVGCFVSSSFSEVFLSVKLQKFIAGNGKWVPTSKPVEAWSDHCLLERIQLMLDSLLASLKEAATRGDFGKAFKTYSVIQLHALSTGSYDLIHRSISPLIIPCANFRLLRQGRQLHGHIISLGFQHHPDFVPKLVTFYGKVNHLAEAHTITENSNILHPLPWNILISSYVRNGMYGEATSAYKQMVSKGIIPDNFTYPSVLKACGENLDIALGSEVHELVCTSSHGWSLFVHNSLISMYGKFGKLDIAHCLFDKIPEKDAVSWNSIISIYASKGMWKEALEMFKKMQLEGVEGNIITWNSCAGGLLRMGNFHGALELLSRMRRKGIHIDPVATIIGLSACSHIRSVKLGNAFHGLAIHSNFDGLENVKNALINMYCRCQDLRAAYFLFQQAKEKSIITWNSMLCGYTNMDCSEEASFLFKQMVHSGVEPNYVSIASILSLCARVANLQHGREFHCYILRREWFKDYLLLYNSLVDMYARSGKILEAKRVFNSLERRDEITYTSLIAGYGIHGHGQAALDLFHEMNCNQIKPDYVTMIAVLSACSHSGLVTEGKILFADMPSVYAILPGLEHFSCMVDLYGRAGLLYEAKEIITSMPYAPNSSMWAVLLGACQIHGNKEIGEWAAEKLFEMKPENAAYYVLIANMYAATGSWNKLANVRTFMRDLGVRKDPGFSSINIGSESFSFSVGEVSNPVVNELYLLLESLIELMKDNGCVGKHFCWDKNILE